MKEISINDITCDYCKINEAEEKDSSKKPVCKYCKEYHKEEALNYYYSENPQDRLQCEVFMSTNSFDFNNIEVGNVIFINEIKHKVTE